MAFRFVEGFDRRAADGSPMGAILTSKRNGLDAYWIQASGALDQETSTSRTGRGEANIVSGVNLRCFADSTQQELVFGFNYRDVNGVAVVERFCDLEYNDGLANNLQCYIQRDTLNRVQFCRGDGTVLAQSDPGVVILQNNNYFQVRCKVDNTTGTVRILRGTTDVFSGGTVGSLDTQHHGSSNTFNQIRFHRSAQNWFIDDFFLFDVTGGGVDADVLTNEPHVYTLGANANGGTNQFTGVGSGTQYLNVDENVPDEDATYNTSNTSTHRDEYGHEDLPANVGTVIGMLTNHRVRRDEGGSATIKVGNRLSGVDDLSAVQSPLSTYEYYCLRSTTKPGGGAWTPADVNSMLSVIENQ